MQRRSGIRQLEIRTRDTCLERFKDSGSRTWFKDNTVGIQRIKEGVQPWIAKKASWKSWFLSSIL